MSDPVAALLDDHAGRSGEAAVPHAVQDNMRYGNLADKRFAARLEVNVERQAFDIVARTSRANGQHLCRTGM